MLGYRLHFSSREMRSFIRSFVSSTTKPTTIIQTLHFSCSANPRNSPITSLLLSNKPLEALNLLHSSNSQISNTLYNSTLASLSSNGLTNPAHNLFDRMLLRKIEFNDVGFGCFVNWLCKSEGLDKVLSLVEAVREMGCRVNGSVLAALIVDGFCRAGKIDEAWNALEELRVIGWKPDFIAYRIVSEGFTLVSRVEEAGKILKQKRKFGVAPRINEYGEFILWLIEERRILEAKQLGEAIIYGDFPIDDNVVDTLIGSVSDVDLESAVLLLKYIIKKNKIPSIALMRHVSANLSKVGNGDEMWDLFRTLSDKGYFSGVEQYNLMVSFLCTVGKLREAYDVLKEMKKKGFVPDVSSYNCLMEACCRNDLLRPAKKLWDEMFANGCCANLRTYNILIGKLLDEGEVEEAQHLFRHMTGKGIIPDCATYKTLIRVLCQLKNVEGAMEVFNKSAEQDVVMAKSTLSTLILALCKEGNYVAAINSMHSLPSNIEDSYSHVILLKSLTVAGAIEMAIMHIRWIKENSPLKLHAILNELIASLSTAPKLDPILQLLRLMHVQGLVSNEDPWMKMLESYYALRRLMAGCLDQVSKNFGSLLGGAATVNNWKMKGDGRVRNVEFMASIIDLTNEDIKDLDGRLDLEDRDIYRV